MKKICPDCGNKGHIYKDGVWKRCKCIKATRVIRIMEKSGVDVRNIGSRITQLKSMTVVSKYGGVIAWLNGFQTRNHSRKGSWAQYGLWLISASPEFRRVFMGGMTREVVELGQHAHVYYLDEVLMTISGDVKRRQEVYHNMLGFDLMILCVGLGVISSRGVQFVGKFLELVCRQRIRGGKATIIVSGDKGEDFRKRVGSELVQILKEKTFVKIEC